jgi:putative glycosyltransferase (TIGR04372 family)
MLLPSAPVILLVLFLRPVILVRFGMLLSGRLGHFSVNTELYLCEQAAGSSVRRTFDVFFHFSPVCNGQLKKMWNRRLHVSPLARWPHWLVSRLPGFGAHVIQLPTDRDLRGLLDSIPAQLSFTGEEETRGRLALGQLGIPENAPIVCIHSRDSGYLDGALPNGNWGYHDYRNSNVQTFIPAAEELARRGYFVVRTGAMVNEALDTKNPRILDYATTGRQEFLDIYLGAKCQFYLGDRCGYDGVCMIFRRPLVLVNMIAMELMATWGKDYLFIPKKLWLRNERRFMTFREILGTGVGRFNQTQKYAQLGIEIVDNTSDEISAVAMEMDERLKNTWSTTEEDEELQRQFWTHFKPSDLNGVFRARIGAEFLRQNRDLLV